MFFNLLKAFYNVLYHENHENMNIRDYPYKFRYAFYSPSGRVDGKASLKLYLKPLNSVAALLSTARMPGQSRFHVKHVIPSQG